MPGARFTAVLGLLLSVALSACAERPPAESPPSDGTGGEPQQQIVARAADALSRMRAAPRFASMEHFLRNARAVMVFPRLIKASLIFGGEGGNGVMLARGVDGSWSAPAFYSVGAPSVGLQIGYQEASVVLFLMNDDVLERALRSNLTLGADATVALGAAGERGEAEREVLSKDVYAFSEAAGAFAGISLEGYVIATRPKHNQAYYGAGANPRTIVIERAFDRPGAEVLRQALTPAKSPGAPVVARPTPTPEPPSEEAPPAAEVPPRAEPGPAPPLRECSPESRQAEVCAEIYQPVCAEVDTGVRCVKAPCPEARTHKTFSNACRACADAKTFGYREGECSARQ